MQRCLTQIFQEDKPADMPVVIEPCDSSCVEFLVIQALPIKANSLIMHTTTFARTTSRSRGAGVWVGAQVDSLVVFVGVVSELGWG